MTSFFVNGAIAWATIGLVSIPIVIHLINRRRFLRLDWAAMEFLLEALKRNRRRLRIEQLILLALRILLMALLGFMIARPILSEGGLGWIASAFRSEDKILVIDDSFSMSRREAGRTAFDRAVSALGDQIRLLADRGGGYDRLTVLRGSRFRSPLSRGIFVDRERALGLSQAVSKLTPCDVRLPLGAALDFIAASSAGEGAEGAPRPRSISILTDLRSSDWTSPQGGADEALHEALRRVAASESVPTRIVVLDVSSEGGAEEGGNVAVTGVTVEGGKAVQDIPVDLNVEVKNFSRRVARGLSLRVRQAIAPVVTGEEASFATSPGPRVKDLEPGASATYTVPTTFRKAGFHGVIVDLAGAGDSLPGDDSYPLVVEVTSATEVLVLSGEPSSMPFEGEADFLAEALAPAGDVASGIRPTVLTEESLPRGDLEKYALAFALNVHSFPQEFLPLLARYVRGGGTLVVFPGDQVDAALYNRQLGAGALDLLPARIGDLRGDPQSPVSMDLAQDHPYFRLLRDSAELVGQVRFQRYLALEPVQGAQVLARFTDVDGSPAIVEHAVERGRVLVFATSADLEWSDWPRSPTYLMVLQEIVAGVLRSKAQRSEPVAGAPLAVPVDIAQYSQEARVRAPGYPGRPERTLVASPAPRGVGGEGRDDRESGKAPGARDGREGNGGPGNGGAPDGGAGPPAFQFVLDDTYQAGLYALGLKAKSGEPEWREIAIRRDPRESNLAAISQTRLRELYPDVTIDVIRDPTAFADVGRGSFEASDLLLWSFLGLLLVEAFLARYFAHHVALSSGIGARGIGARGIGLREDRAEERSRPATAATRAPATTRGSA